MKERILKLGVALVLIAVLVATGVYPLTSSQAAAKGTTYNVVLQTGSPGVNYISINGGTALSQPSDNTGITFKMVVDAKAKTEKVKSTGQTATYYPVTILAKSFHAPSSKFVAPGYANALATIIMLKDAKGKLYTSGGDVDVSSVMGKKLVSTIGDRTADPAGSLVIDQLTLSAIATDQSTGKVFLQLPLTNTMTTGKSSIVVKGTKTKLEGKVLPNDDNGKNVPTPLVGEPVDLEAGTGTLVGTTGTLGIKNKTLGMMDILNDTMWVMKITKQ